jgi:hypothetical protein
VGGKEGKKWMLHRHGSLEDPFGIGGLGIRTIEGDDFDCLNSYLCFIDKRDAINIADIIFLILNDIMVVFMREFPDR